MRTLLTSLLVFACALSLADGYRDDPRLAKPVSLRLKIASLSTFAKELGKDTGVGIAVAQNIADRKITTIFNNRPATEAMAMVEKTFFCNWLKDSSGYRLVMPREAAREEADQLQAEQSYLRSRVAEIVGQMAEIGRPKEEQIETRDRIKAEMDRLRPMTDSESKKQYQKLRAELLKFRWIDVWEMGFALHAAPTAPEALAAGETLYASTVRGVALPLPSASIPTFRVQVLVPSPDGGQPKVEQRSPSGAFAAIRCNLFTGNLDLKVLAMGLGPNSAGGTSRTITVLDSGEADSALSKTSLRARLRAWAGFKDTDLLAAKIDRSKSTASSPRYLAKAYSIAEHLEFMSDCAGIPVMADAFRLPASNEGFLSAGTVKEYVGDLLSQTFPAVQSGHFRTENGWLLFKHPKYWRRLGSEIPESLFAPLEQKKSSLALEDYVTFASALTPLQAAVFPNVPSLTRFPRLPLVNGLPALRVWGSLSMDQRQAAYGSGLPYSGLSQSQKGLYIEAINSLLWSYGLTETFFPLLLGRADPSDQIGFMMQDAGNGGSGVIEMGHETQEENTEPQRFTMEDLERLKPRSVRFVFGANTMSGAGYNILLPAGKL